MTAKKENSVAKNSEVGKAWKKKKNNNTKDEGAKEVRQNDTKQIELVTVHGIALRLSVAVIFTGVQGQLRAFISLLIAAVKAQGEGGAKPGFPMEGATLEASVCTQLLALAALFTLTGLLVREASDDSQEEEQKKDVEEGTPNTPQEDEPRAPIRISEWHGLARSLAAIFAEASDMDMVDSDDEDDEEASCSDFDTEEEEEEEGAEQEALEEQESEQEEDASSGTSRSEDSAKKSAQSSDACIGKSLVNFDGILLKLACALMFLCLREAGRLTHVLAAVQQATARMGGVSSWGGMERLGGAGLLVLGTGLLLGHSSPSSKNLHGI